MYFEHVGRNLRSTFCATVAVASVLTFQSAFAQTADIVFTNADVRTMDEANPLAEAVAITGNTITYVGDTAGAQALIGDETRVIDAHGRLMIPGFIETHLHLLVAAAAISGVVADQRDDADDVARKVVEYAEANPGDSTIFGTGVAAALLTSGTVGDERDPLGPADQVLTVDEAIRGYTAGSAKLIGKFDELGSITEGKKADLIVLSDNVYEIGVEDIAGTTVLLTMMDGRITYAEPSAAAAAALDDPKIQYGWQE